MRMWILVYHLNFFGRKYNHLFIQPRRKQNIRKHNLSFYQLELVDLNHLIWVWKCPQNACCVSLLNYNWNSFIEILSRMRITRLFNQTFLNWIKKRLQFQTASSQRFKCRPTNLKFAAFILEYLGYEQNLIIVQHAQTNPIFIYFYFFMWVKINLYFWTLFLLFLCSS